VIDTGSIQIKQCHFENCKDDDSSFPRRLISILLDSKPAPQRLPILTYLIQHPEGNFLIDTGADPDWDNQETWECSPRSHFAAKRIADIQYQQAASLPQELKRLGIQDDLTGIIITHAHFDHTGNLRNLKAEQVIIGKEDLDNHDKIGAVKCKYLEKNNLTPAVLTPPKGGETDEYAAALQSTPVYLTKDKSLRYYVTPGHTPGSLVVVQTTDRGDLVFVGDITFSAEQIKESSPVAGMHFNIPQIRSTHKILRDLSRSGNKLLLPSHEEDISSKISSFSSLK
jgi:glyoxylase-like metal-dependent hydrolase (beta-lactamase superfamily II)